VRFILSLWVKVCFLETNAISPHTYTHMYITEVIQTVCTLTGNFYPIWNKGWMKGVIHHQQWTCRTVTQLPGTQTDSYNSTDREMSVDHVVLRMWLNAIAHHLAIECPTRLLSDSLFLGEPSPNLESRANSQILMSFLWSVPQN
jgi:hypothetical protein